MITAMITAGQAARAMGLDEKEMAVLLNESGVCTANGLLTPADTETLLSYLAGQQEDSRRRAQENLERLSARYAFLIDTCSLLDEHFPALVEHPAADRRLCPDVGRLRGSAVPQGKKPVGTSGSQDLPALAAAEQRSIANDDGGSDGARDSRENAG